MARFPAISSYRGGEKAKQGNVRFRKVTFLNRMSQFILSVGRVESGSEKYRREH